MFVHQPSFFFKVKDDWLLWIDIPLPKKNQTYATHSNGKVWKDDSPILSFDEKSDLPWSVPFVFFAEALSVGVQSSAQAILWPTSQLYMKRNMQISPPPKTMTRSFFKTCMFPDLAKLASKWLESARLGVGRCTHRSRRVHRTTVSLEIAITWRLFCGPGLAGIKETDVSQALTPLGTLEMGEKHGFPVAGCDLITDIYNWTNKRVP